MKNTDGETSRDSGVLSSPLSFLRSGHFYLVGTGLDARGGSGNYWSLRSGSTTGSNNLYFVSTALDPQGNDSRGFGFAVHLFSIPTSDKSFTTLINTSYSMKNGYDKEDNMDSGVLSNPLTFVHGGRISWNKADVEVRDFYGIYWILRSDDKLYSNYFNHFDTGVNPQNSGSHGAGFVVRQILHQSH